MPHAVNFKNDMILPPVDYAGMCYPPEIGSELEALFSADGDVATFSNADLELARSKFCGVEREKYQISKYICDANGNIAGGFDSAAKKIEGLLRDSPCTISPENPINQVLDIELELSSEIDVENARKELNDILGEVKKELNNRPGRTPQERLKLVYDVILKRGIEWADSVDLLTDGLKKKKLDCDTSAFIVMAVAHEFGWPVKLIEAPEHVFVRWDEGLMAFNMEYGDIISDDAYERKFKIGRDAFAVSCDMKGLAHFNRGVIKAGLGRYKEAIRDYNEAIRTNPFSADARYNRGVAKYTLGRYKEAVMDYKRVIKLIKKAEVYNNLGVALRALGRDEEAIKSFKMALIVDPDFTKARDNLRHVK